jgi:hypothetical protein
MRTEPLASWVESQRPTWIALGAAGAVCFYILVTLTTYSSDFDVGPTNWADDVAVDLAVLFAVSWLLGYLVPRRTTGGEESDPSRPRGPGRAQLTSWAYRRAALRLAALGAGLLFLATLVAASSYCGGISHQPTFCPTPPALAGVPVLFTGAAVGAWCASGASALLSVRAGAPREPRTPATRA